MFNVKNQDNYFAKFLVYVTSLDEVGSLRLIKTLRFHFSCFVMEITFLCQIGQMLSFTYQNIWLLVTVQSAMHMSSIPSFVCGLAPLSTVSYIQAHFHNHSGLQ